MILNSRSVKYAGTYYMPHQGTVVLIPVHPNSRNRGWFKLSSGGREWKTQSPVVYFKESEAWRVLMLREVYNQRWIGWDAKAGRGKIIDRVSVNAAVDRLYDASCRMWRARQREICK